MRIIKNIIVAFSLYSAIPMPHFEWKEEDMKHNIVFLPWIGAVIGALSFGLSILLNMIDVPQICRLALYAVIPLVVTGGFHVDGFMDVQDALRSYKSKEEKLEILKDPHIGAFAVIRLVIFVLVWMAAGSVILSKESNVFLYTYFCIFFPARAVTGLSCLKLKQARKSGMLRMETQKSTGADFVVCLVQAVLAVAVLAFINVYIAALLVVVSIIHFFFYRALCYREFGGVTGDTAGFCVTTLEEWMLVAIAASSFLI